MAKANRNWVAISRLIFIGAALLAACQPSAPVSETPPGGAASVQNDGPRAQAAVPQSTPLPTRPAYEPGELVAYEAQAGDSLPALAAHFNTTVDEILAANPIIPKSATTLPPGLPMEIPIYYLPLWGSPYQIIPNSLFVNGPAQVNFDTADFINGHPGWLKTHGEYAAGANRDSANVVDYVAQQFSISPQLLLALLEYQTGALRDSSPSAEDRTYPLENPDRTHRGLYLQLVWAANLLNNGYYRWQMGDLAEINLADGRLERPDPWQNSATVALQFYFSQLYSPADYTYAISADGFAWTYAELFGDPWTAVEPHIPGSLAQPMMKLPFELDRTWAYTGGPHTAWGEGQPYSALDFAPPAVIGGCQDSEEWATAVADGLIVRSEPATVVLDLDGDGDERTGWVVFYFHLASPDRAPAGLSVKAGDRLGHPSCEGGRATGTHVHIARKYNGEWIQAGGVIPFDLDGWIAKAGAAPYQGTMTRFERTVEACQCSNQASQLSAEEP
jgi:hypothetical protein